MVHVITEADMFVVHDKLPESWKLGNCSRLFHLLNATKNRNERRVIVFMITAYPVIPKLEIL